MKRKFIWVLTGVILFVMPFIVVNADTQNGWVQENGKTYYYENGEKVKGFKEIDGKTYFFSNVNSVLKTGVQKLNNDTSQMFYLNNDGTVYHGWKKIEGNTYYFGDNHYAIRGFKEIDGQMYFFSNINNALKKGVQKLNNDITQMFYLNNDGTVYHGWKKIDGNTYYFGDNHYAVRGFKDIGGNTYFFSMINNTLKTGVQKLNNDITQMFYLNNDGTVYHGWKKIDGATYYFGDDYYAVRGFKNIEGKTYFFSNVNNALKTGWQKLYNDRSKTFYLTEEGIVCDGLQTIDKDTYYFGEDHFAKSGIQTIDGKKYYFNEENYKLLVGLQEVDNKLIYTKDNGEVQYGWQTVKGNTYYFGEDGFAVKGFQPIDGKTYFFSNINYALKKGLQHIDGRPFYLNDDGSIYQGWKTVEGNTYYFGEDSFALKGFQPIDGKTYFFSNINYALKSGFQTLDGKTFYLNNDGTLFQESGFQTINNKKYYFENNYVIKGSKEIEGKTYYFDTKTGELKTGVYKQNGNEYYYDNYGKLTKIQYIPKYYSQRDSRWSNTYYGSGNMKNSGCAPTSMAMAFSSILERTILPVDVAYYLYHKTTEFNKPTLGASGRAVQLAASHFGVKWKGLASTTEIANALSNGKIVFANVGPGKFTSPGLTHAIVLYKNENGNTLAMDPYNSGNNGKISISTVWAQRSKNSYDLRGGYAFYALG